MTIKVKKKIVRRFFLIQNSSTLHDKDKKNSKNHPPFERLNLYHKVHGMSEKRLMQQQCCAVTPS